DGNGVVKGNVQLHYYVVSDEIGVLGAQDEVVFLQFENSDEILDRYRTDALGNFEIGNLIPGKYKIFVYSDSRFPAEPDSACVSHFEITNNSSVVTLDTFNIKLYK
ncbi:MAG: hypothetical protein J6V74_02415, partial [Bacteroidales bacterium]|nr:hypothetical protein [Bacteroidales bacterium]